MKFILRACGFILLTLAAGSARGATPPDAEALQTAQGPVAVYPVHHASFVMHWNGQAIYVDPTESADLYKNLGTPDLILITHPHHDHLSPETLAALDTSRATVVMPKSVADEIGNRFGKAQVILANGDSTDLHGIGIHAVPMYNLPAAGKKIYHPKGWGNGYVLTLGHKRVYISGDTEGTPEMRALKHIDMAFVCMNLPYTMDVDHAAAAVLAFRPAVVYPYHYRGQDVQRFKRLVNAKAPAIEVRLRGWYAQ